jgi:hypothetical protein
VEVFMIRPFVVLLLALGVCLAPVAAQQPQATQTQGFSLGLGLGVDTFGGETYQKISLTPDIAFGKFGIGVDVTVHYRFENSEVTILDDDWVADDFQDALGLYLSKFRYIRYGLKGEPLFVKLGSIDDGTLGNGFIMGNYANTLFLPQRRVFGLSLDVDGQLVGFPYVGVETHVGDLAAFDVVGARGYVRPLAGTQIPVLHSLQIGATYAADLDPYRDRDRNAATDEKALAALAGVDPADAMVYLAGVDFRQPIVDTPVFSLAAFGDAVTQKAKAYGSMLGLGGRLAAIFTYGAQLRFIGDDFVPVYFDSTYDITAPTRYALTTGAASSPGFIGWFATVGTSLLNDSIVFKATLDGPFGEVDSNGANYLNYMHLTAFAGVAEGLLPGFFFDASYDKMLINEWNDLVGPRGGMAKARLNYRSGPAVISFFYLLRYNSDDWNDPEVSSGLETVVQLN